MAVLFEIRQLSKSFGGNTAVSGFDADISKGEIVGLVARTARAKAQYCDLVTGYLKADKGMASKGETMTGLRPDQIAKKGIGRTFQITRLFHGQTVTESVLAGHIRQEKTGLWPPFNADPEGAGPGAPDR